MKTVVCFLLVLALGCSTLGCSSMPDPKHERFGFPKLAIVGKPKRPYKIIGYVRAATDFVTLDPVHSEEFLCKNYYNNAVEKLLKYAKEKKADAVMDVQSVTLQVDGKLELHDTPECSDEGGEGQVLVRGTAIQWDVPDLDPTATKKQVLRR